MSTQIKSCDCNRGPAAEFQDVKYGKGKRVHNEAKKSGGWRCTCCGTLKIK